jgi:hypothetical protein
LVAALGLSFFGSGGGDQYDQGYDSAWEGEDEPSSWASRDLKEGYEDGLSDADAYDEGGITTGRTTTVQNTSMTHSTWTDSKMENGKGSLKKHKNTDSG